MATASHFTAKSVAALRNSLRRGRWVGMGRVSLKTGLIEWTHT